MTAYYNEIDAYAAGWLRNLIAAGHIAAGDVDTRSIVDVRPDDLRGYDQCHFFAGIGGWPLALGMAGWGSRPVWTGSCPCQPFSAAGKRKGAADERHLWPEFRRLIAECRPPVVFGEQVASSDGRRWLSGVRADLEALGYGVGAADMCAASVGAPHIRQRLWWVADADQGECGRIADREGGFLDRPPSGRLESNGFAKSGGASGRLAQSDVQRREGEGVHIRSGRQDEAATDEPWAGCGLGDADEPRLEERVGNGRVQREALGAHPRETAWGASWLGCTDGKARRAQPGILPLADGVPGRVGKLRAYGNAIVPQVAAEFIAAALTAQSSSP